jgi:hypothetical protein
MCDMSTQTDDAFIALPPIPETSSYLGYASSFLYPISTGQKNLSRQKSNDSMSSEVTSVDDLSPYSGSKIECSVCTASTITSPSSHQHSDHASNCPIEELATPFMTSTLVHLNVGGVYYDTTIETLVRDSDSSLCEMFDGVRAGDVDDCVVGSQIRTKAEYENLKVETPGVGADGRFFIDRDGITKGGSHYLGALFHHVLNYLRADGGDVREYLPTSRQALWALVSEARFYGLVRLQV